MSTIETKWLPVGHFGFYICKKNCYLYYLFSYHAICPRYFQIKRSDENFAMKRSNEYFFASGRNN